METIGISEGWRCLEVGAGEGSIARWLANRVGPTGIVVATDINTEFLSRIGASNLEIRQHDILKDELEKGHYDLVHFRKVLHLPDPEKAAKRMAEAVRPGGWLLIEEDDYGSRLSVDVVDSSAAPFSAALRTFFGSLRERGITDYYFGRRIRGLVEQLEFMDVAQEGWTSMVRGGDPWARLWAMSWEGVVKPMIAEGIVTQEQYETVHRLLLDLAFYFPDYTLFSAWGRKPVQATPESKGGE
jgi:SAM-dependent methyltransferase